MLVRAGRLLQTGFADDQTAMGPQRVRKGYQMTVMLEPGFLVTSFCASVSQMFVVVMKILIGRLFEKVI